MKLSEKLKNKELISDCYSLIGQIYERQENNQQAAAYHFKGLKLNRNIGDSVRIATSLSLLGNIYGATKQAEKALKSYRESLSYINEKLNLEQVGVAYGNIGYVYYEEGSRVKLGNPEKAKRYFDQSLEASMKAKQLFEDLNNRRFSIIAELNIGLVYNELKDFGTAKNGVYRLLQRLKS